MKRLKPKPEGLRDKQLCLGERQNEELRSLPGRNTGTSQGCTKVGSPGHTTGKARGRADRSAFHTR